MAVLPTAGTVKECLVRTATRDSQSSRTLGGDTMTGGARGRVLAAGTGRPPRQRACCSGGEYRCLKKRCGRMHRNPHTHASSATAWLPQGESQAWRPKTTSANPMDRVIWLARHARRQDFDDPQWSASSPRPYDPPLSEDGRRQAQAMADRLATESIDHLFSSPFLRCVETAAAIAGQSKLTIKLEVGLSEWLNADWFSKPPELLPTADLVRSYPQVDPAYRSRGRARYGESGTAALQRSGDTARTLTAEFDGNLAMVGHGASVRGAMIALLEIAPEDGVDLGYGCLLGLVHRGGRWRIRT